MTHSDCEDEDEPVAKYRRNRSTTTNEGRSPLCHCTLDRSMPRCHSTYQQDLPGRPDRHDRQQGHVVAPLMPCPYVGDVADPRVAMAHSPYAAPPWSPPTDSHQY